MHLSDWHDSETHRHEVEKHLKHFSEDVDKKLRKPLIPAFEAVRDAIGEKNVNCCFVLSHFKTADILLAFDENTQHFTTPQNCTDDNVTRVVVMLLSKAQTSFDDQPLGMLHCKLRQLQKLGYTVVQVSLVVFPFLFY
ncbi:hypothetical protein ElyMa_000643300 [Elysia marginata]|uniref:Caspase family p20 domain-containing protein n=1 Tax=Elysia marginata TaxID=1093978 RepID=A0AAV4GBU2_9GAST|nr:hypothetical protein ElyMa_000643300 [Elysia marginata]